MVFCFQKQRSSELNKIMGELTVDDKDGQGDSDLLDLMDSANWHTHRHSSALSVMSVVHILHVQCYTCFFGCECPGFSPDEWSPDLKDLFDAQWVVTYSRFWCRRIGDDCWRSRLYQSWSRNSATSAIALNCKYFTIPPNMCRILKYSLSWNRDQDSIPQLVA